VFVLQKQEFHKLWTSVTIDEDHVYIGTGLGSILTFDMREMKVMCQERLKQMTKTALTSPRHSPILGDVARLLPVEGLRVHLM